MAFTSLTAPNTVTSANQGETSLGENMQNRRFLSLAHLQHLNHINSTLRTIERKILYDTLNTHFDGRTRISYMRKHNEMVEAEIESRALSKQVVLNNLDDNLRSVRFPINSRDGMDGAVIGRNSLTDPWRYDSLAEYHWNLPVRGQELLNLIDMLRHYADLWSEERGKQNDTIILEFDPYISSDLTSKETMLYDMACSLIGMDQLL